MVRYLKVESILAKKEAKNERDVSKHILFLLVNEQDSKGVEKQQKQSIALHKLYLRKMNQTLLQTRFVKLKPTKKNVRGNWSEISPQVHSRKITF